MKRKYIGRFDIETPSGKRESYQVRPKNSAHFNTAKAAENAARRMGHIKLQSNKYPNGSTATKYFQDVNVLSNKEIRNRKGIWGF